MKEKVYKKILEEIKTNGDLLFTEIESIFEEENFNYKGDKCLLHPKNKNLVVWVEWNEKAINIIMQLLKEPNIVASKCNTIETLLYSQYLGLPIAQKENYNYKNPHWFPSKIKWINK